MKKLILAAILCLWSFPALAADCSVVSCNCIGVVYKDPDGSGPSSFARRIFSWDKAERRFNNQLIGHRVALMLISYEGNSLHICCELIDNNNASAPWDSVSVSYIPAENGELDRLIVGFYDNAPAAGDRFHIIAGDDTTPAVLDPDNPASNGLEITALMGGSNPRDLVTGQTVITNARNNHKPTLQSDMIADGC